MRDFSWRYFAITGDVDAYLLYNEVNRGLADREPIEEIFEEEDMESFQY